MCPRVLKIISTQLSCSCQLNSKKILLSLLCLGFLGFFLNTNIPFLSPPLFAVCRPKESIVFLKTHKCAGSSLQNILMRYGDSRNFTFVLPSSGNYLGHPTPFSARILPRPLLPSYNILAHHARLNYQEMRRLMPESTVFITIVRDPVTVFESSYSYYGLDKFFGGDLHKLLHVSPDVTSKFLSRRPHGKFGVNQMLFDLGAEPGIFDNDTLVQNYVNQLDSWFHLVLVAERMDESLVLLKNLLCWETDDVVTFKINARNPKFKRRLSQEEEIILRNLNRADQILYEHFGSKLQQQVEAYGQRMEEEVKLLRQRTKSWYELCVKGEGPLITPRTKSRYYLNPRVMVLQPRQDVENYTCKLLTEEELAFTDHLRNKQASLVKNMSSRIGKRKKYSQPKNSIGVV